MGVTAVFITAAITVGSLTPSQAVPAPKFAAPIAADVQSIRLAGNDSSSTKRPSMLIPMYASLAVLQGLDIYTTSSAIESGAVEANPLVKPVAGRHVASALVKAAATAGSIYFTERAWKKNRKGALILMTAINVATAAVVAHNTQVARR